MVLNGRWVLTVGWLRALAPMCLLCVVGSAAAQDAVKLSGFWIEPVTVTSIRNGLVNYETEQGVAVSRSVELLEGLRLQRYPALSEAREATQTGDDRAAVALLEKVADAANEDWVRYYVKSQQVDALVRLDEAEDAVEAYLDLMMAGADTVYLAKPPVNALARADAAVRQRAVELIRTAKQAMDEQRALYLQQLLDAAGQPANVVAAPEPGTTSTNHSGLVLSSSAPPGTIVNLFNRQRYHDALRAADEALSQPGRMGAEFYLKGMAQLALAEVNEEEAGYKSAGLSFMRVVTYYPRSAVAGPAWLEAGYIHEKIGRPDIAERLYQRANTLIREDEDPATYRRLQNLSADLAE